MTGLFPYVPVAGTFVVWFELASLPFGPDDGASPRSDVPVRRNGGQMTDRYIDQDETKIYSTSERLGIGVGRSEP